MDKDERGASTEGACVDSLVPVVRVGGVELVAGSFPVTSIVWNYIKYTKFKNLAMSQRQKEDNDAKELKEAKGKSENSLKETGEANWPRLPFSPHDHTSHLIPFYCVY